MSNLNFGLQPVEERYYPFCDLNYCDDVTVNHPVVRASDPPLHRKTLRRGNAIEDGDMDQHAATAPTIKIREKKQKS